ncbi:hypothetical protein [uncultured Veillonella sp.]|uniref:hypothetical protein n=1 Tax=uncultured Veillonella sp. TaxID=159268 RepID=UPI0025E89E7E|nr:hypothetical protein [uncultured Veillonella sp.]
MKGGDYMYKNLNAELARMGWTRKDLVVAADIRYQTLNEMQKSLEVLKNKIDRDNRTIKRLRM